MRPFPIWCATLLLALAALFLHHRGSTDQVPRSRPLDQMPRELGSWHGEDQPIAQEALDVLGKGIFLNRVYLPSSSLPSVDPALQAPVSLFIGYFPTQRTGSTIHSPQNCLPGAGWTFESTGTTDVSAVAGKDTRVGDYVVSNGPAKLEILYWYQTQGKAIANDYRAKFQLMADSIRYNRSDAALVRVITPIQKGESREVARNRAKAFTRNFLPILPAFVPN